MRANAMLMGEAVIKSTAVIDVVTKLHIPIGKRCLLFIRNEEMSAKVFHQRN